MFDLIDKNDKKQMSKKVIDAIFDEIPKVELPPIKSIISAKSRRVAMICVAIMFVLASFALISIKGSSEAIESQQIANYEEPFEYEEDFGYASGEAKLISRGKTIEDFAIKQPVIANPSYTPTITKISWEAPESLVKKGSYTKFLQLIGKNVKLNLQNDLLLVNDIPTNKIVKVDIRISANGDVDSIKMIASSGSSAIDSSVKKVVNDTLTYMKPPSHGIISRPVDITLTLELN